MKFAAAHRLGSERLSGLTQTERISIYVRQNGSFNLIETRALPAGLQSERHVEKWLSFLRDCRGIIARSFPPRLAYDLQAHNIFTLSGDSFGPNGLFEALEFLFSIAGNESYENGAGI